MDFAANDLPEARGFTGATGRTSDVRPLRVRQKSLFRRPLMRQRLFHPLVRQLFLLHGLHEGLERLGLQIVVPAAHEHHVTSSRHRLNGRSRHGPSRRDRLHFHVVREDKSLIPELVSKQPLNDRRRKRCRMLLVDRRDDDMTRHQGGHASPHRRAKGLELDGAESIGIVFDVRQVVV